MRYLPDHRLATTNCRWNLTSRHICIINEPVPFQKLGDKDTRDKYSRKCWRMLDRSLALKSFILSVFVSSKAVPIRDAWDSVQTLYCLITHLWENREKRQYWRPWDYSAWLAPHVLVYKSRLNGHWVWICNHWGCNNPTKARSPVAVDSRTRPTLDWLSSVLPAPVWSWPCSCPAAVLLNPRVDRRSRNPSSGASHSLVGIGAAFAQRATPHKRQQKAVVLLCSVKGDRGWLCVCGGIKQGDRVTAGPAQLPASSWYAM